MEADSDASESDADPAFLDSPSRADSRSPRRAPSAWPHFLAGLFLLIPFAPQAKADALDDVRARGSLRYGSDMEGGGPYAFPDPSRPRDVTGFEVEMMRLLARDLEATAE